MGELANATFEQWRHWTELASQQRLLQCCYILEYQQATLLARAPQPSMLRTSVIEIPFPVHSSVWDATCPRDWALGIRQCMNMPKYVYELSLGVLAKMEPGSFDIFQSALVTASHYHLYNDSAQALISNPASNALAIANPLDGSLTTKHRLLIAKLNRVTPVRSLLAVIGESWILVEKVLSPAAMKKHESVLQSWVNGLWSPPANSQGQDVQEALKLATDILQNAIAAPPGSLRLEFGGDMGLYFAALVIWAITVAVDARAKALDTRNEQSGKDIWASFFAETNKLVPAHTSMGPNSMAPQATHVSSMPLPTSNSIVRSEITMASLDFLADTEVEIALLGLVPQATSSLSRWQQGCISLMRWVKARIRDGEVESETVSNSTGMGLNETLGELLDAVIAVLEKAIQRCADLWPPLLETPGGTPLFYSGESPIDPSYEAELWTDDSVSSLDSSQSLDEFGPAILMAAGFLYDQFQAWHGPRSLQPTKDQAETDEQVNNINGACSSSATGESAGSFANESLQQQCRKRPPGDDDNSNDGRPPGKRRKFTNVCEEPDIRLLACPFAKKDPLRHRKCFKYVLQDIARLK